MVYPASLCTTNCNRPPPEFGVTILFRLERRWVIDSLSVAHVAYWRRENNGEP